MNTLQSILKYRCPRCRKSNLFTEPFNFAKPLDMPRNCANCNQKFEPEPGFYFGAMFISYGISALIFIPLALLAVFYFKMTVNAVMGFVIFGLILIFFRLMRVSRSIWIHFIVKYEVDKAKK